MNFRAEPCASVTTEPIKQRKDLTDEELNSLQDVCDGKIARKDSLVSDAKFDMILSSLQTLASNISKDFDEQTCDEAESDGDEKTEKPCG